MQLRSILATAAIASMANPVLGAAMPQTADAAPQVFGCFVRKSVVIEVKDDQTITAVDWRETTNPGQLEFTDGDQKITVKVDKNCQSAGITAHRKEVKFGARQKRSKNGGAYEDPDQRTIDLV
ncbi:uncharacterized protein PpBr36_09614 [Pyricularia pennisetigena]|uniref:uncharacterized protein n=1 Tax=Pyricularia pennisetigena TaxID=1578925 RepID=UPI001152C116|nr:uncharacterized protein PpBr36_09614 [Pyricularia pennisetigena]TLS21920.1 hypothetical protein PpBr36_09614 [Pyricularia pennisetigena]